jgi:hypothetical protein
MKQDITTQANPTEGYYYPEGTGQIYPDGFNPDSIRKTRPTQTKEKSNQTEEKTNEVSVETPNQNEETIKAAKKARAYFDAGTFCG